MSECKATVPLAKAETNECHVTPKWFVDKSEYKPLFGTFRLLINGEEAFEEVYRAIDAAKKSVCIICWGFQPSMYFIRNGASLSIGQLLEKKAREGVVVRVLCWDLEPLDRKTNVTGMKVGLAESNTPGRWDERFEDRPLTSTDSQYAYDVSWYDRYDEDQEYWDNKIKKVRGVFDRKSANLHFRGRGFSDTDRAVIAASPHADKGLGAKAKGMLSAFPTHHQKMVLVDYEDKDRCVGFVMGHNMLDEYWDTNQHSYRQSAPNRGRNGIRPRHDFSSRVTGPITGDLFNNFALAWAKEAKEALPPASFSSYPLGAAGPAQGGLGRNQVIVGQILRTQMQYGRQDIKACYLQAVNNASQYIYIENQYFRWPPLADKIKASAAGQNSWGRKPEVHGPLYLFVVTNASQEGMGPGVHNTYRMLESLGRADTLPEVTRQERAEDLDAQIGQAKNAVSRAKAEKAALDKDASLMPRSGVAAQSLNQRYAAVNAKLAAAEARQKQLEQAKAKVKDKDTTILPEERPGLKIHVCTLVAPDSPGRKGQTAENDATGRALSREERIARAQARLDAANREAAPWLKQRASLDAEARQLQGVPGASASLTQRYASINQHLARRDAAEQELKALKDGSNPIDWVDVYIHAKLMLIDDTFMTLGSANINTRSMEVDSELNIAHHRPEITQPARKKLWGMHTADQSGGEQMGKDGLKLAYKAWGQIIKQNKDNRAKSLAPVASLVEFYSGTSERTDMD